jgi:AcrR family transcriptional regulator
MNKLLKSFYKILIEEGFQKLGINNIAKKAGVSKVLIYRYYTDFNGLLEAYLEYKSFWLAQGGTNVDSLITLDNNQLKSMAIALFEKLLDDLTENIEQQEIRRWEIMEYNEAIDRIGKKIEFPSLERNRTLARILGITEQEIAGILGILIGGIYYLVLRAKTTECFNGIDLRTNTGIEQIKKSISFIINKLL